MCSVVNIDVNNYEAGLAKLEQLEALLLLASSQGLEPFGRLVTSAQNSLAILAYELALDAHGALEVRNIVPISS